MDGSAFLQDLTVVMVVAAVTTVVFSRLKLPVVLGYVLAGLIVGPHTPPFPLITDPKSIETLSQLGVLMLMFSLGIQFSFRGLVRVGPRAGVAGLIEMLLMVWVGYLLGRAFGWEQLDSLFLGAMLLSSSTALIGKTLGDLRLMNADFARTTLGILVLDDLAAMASIGVLSGIALSGAFSPVELLETGGRIVLFLIVFVVMGLVLLPRLLRLLVELENDEVLLVAALGLAFGMALLAVNMGFSSALGAFVVGAVIAETKHGQRVRDLIAPVRDMFSAVFFVSIGLLLDPALLKDHWPEVLVVTGVLVVGKTLTGALGCVVAGYDLKHSLRVGLSLAQIGEFAFIIAALGQSLGVTSEFLYAVAVCVSGLSTLTTPTLIARSERIAQWVERRTPVWLVDLLGVYHRWARRAGEGSLVVTPGSVARAQLRRILLQMTVNVALLTALFIAATWVARVLQKKLEFVPAWLGGGNTLVYLGTLLLSLPVLVAAARKLRAGAMIIAEVTITSGSHLTVRRSLVTNVLLFVGALPVVVYMTAIGAAIAPSTPVLLVLVVIVSGVAWAWWRQLVRIYASGQVAVGQSLSGEDPEPESVTPTPALPATLPELRLLGHAVLQLVELKVNAPAAGRLIHELDVRRATGAMIAGLERGTESIVSPGPNQELRTGDKVLLLGSREQVNAARLLLTGS